MEAFTRLLQIHPAVFFHLVSALGAIALGAVLMLGRKGTLNHRVLGWTWVVLMASATLTSAFIPNEGRFQLAGFGPIHVLTLLVAVMLPRGIWYIRNGVVSGHRKTMTGLFVGACIVAGAFTLLPGRFLGQLVWHQWLGLV